MFAILYRPRKGGPWEMCSLSTSLKSAWRTAKAIERQERAAGNKQCQGRVVDDKDAGSRDPPALNLPEGFTEFDEPTYGQAAPVVEKRVPVARPVVVRPAEIEEGPLEELDEIDM